MEITAQITKQITVKTNTVLAVVTNGKLSYISCERPTLEYKKDEDEKLKELEGYCKRVDTHLRDIRAVCLKVLEVQREETTT